ncbi:MAG TPA: glycosyltransferase family 87 protein [Longilinea sp.]|nr:glycosyltransferase family 87 protein [Longilinea sp.]
MDIRTRRTAAITIVAIIIALLLLAGITYGNYRYSVENPGGTDFLVHWVGTRALFGDGLSPYSDQVALRIQTMVYGRAALPGEHELRVAYPLYSIVLFSPFALISNFDLARAFWMTFLEIALVLMTFLLLRVAEWKPKPIMLALLLIFSVLWYHAMRPLINGNAVILIALGLTGALLAIKYGADELAGVLLAFTTIKPQVVIVIIIFILFWALSQNRKRLILWFFIALVLLCASAMLLIPDWMIQNLREILRYSSYNPPGTPAAALASWWPTLGTRIGELISAACIVIMLVEWWFARKGGYRRFLWTACLTLVASQWVGIENDPGNFIVLMPALILGFSVLAERWKAGTVATVLIMLVLLAGLWALFVATVQHSYQPIQSPVMLFPLPAFLFVLLYWIRWWAIRPLDLWHSDDLLQ